MNISTAVEGLLYRRGENVEVPEEVSAACACTTTHLVLGHWVISRSGLWKLGQKAAMFYRLQVLQSRLHLRRIAYAPE